jgi:hypothetical protein
MKDNDVFVALHDLDWTRFCTLTRSGHVAGPTGGVKFRKGVDASGRVAKVIILCLTLPFI